MQYVVNHPCRIPRHVQDLCLPTALAYIISMDLFTQSEIADHGAEGFKGFRPGRTAWSCTDICGAEGGWEYDVTSSVSRVRRERRRLSSWTERPSWLSGRACMLHPSVKRLAWRRGGKSRLLWPGCYEIAKPGLRQTLLSVLHHSSTWMERSESFSSTANVVDLGRGSLRIRCYSRTNATPVKRLVEDITRHHPSWLIQN